MHPGFLQTKFHRPSMPAAVIPRPGLIRHLHAGLGARMTLVSAPAGAGKSTILSAWLTQLVDAPAPAAPIRSSWLTLDATDDQLPRFLRYFVAAVEQAYPSSCADVTDLLQANLDPSIETVSNVLLNSLSLLPGRLVLVLDDLHEIQNGDIYALLERLVAYTPPTLHLILSTRVDPPLPLVRWRAKGWLTELRQQHLYFTAEEAAAFLAVNLVQSPSPAVASALYRQTEGWPVGMRLAALALEGHDDQNAFVADFEANSSRYVIDYLGEDVLRQQPPDLQTFLLCTAILRRFNPALCAAVLQVDEAAAERQLLAVARANLFLVELDASRRWHRYHHQFQSMLLSSLHARVDAATIAALYRRAAAWAAEHLEMPEALGYLLAIGDLEAAADLIERRRVMLLNTQRYQELSEALALIPPDLRDRRPALLLADAWVHRWWFDWPQTLTSLAQVAQWMRDDALPRDAPTRSLLELEIMALRAGLGGVAAEQSTLPQIQDIWARAQPYLAEIHSDIPIILAQRCQVLGGIDAAMRVVADGWKQSGPWPPIARCNLLNVRAIVQFWAGNLAEAEQDALSSLQQARQHRLPTVEGPCRLILGVVAAARNQLAAAQPDLLAVAADFTVGNGRYAMLAVSKLIDIGTLQGELGPVRPLLARLRVYARLVNLRYLSDHIAALGAYVALVDGDLPHALAWALEGHDAPLAYSMYDPAVRIPLIRARILLAEASPASLRRAELLLRELVALHESRHHFYYAIEAQIAQAVAWARLNDPGRALAILQPAVARAVPLGIFGLFALHGRPMQDLLRLLRSETDAQAQVDLLLATFPTSAPAPQATLLEPLSPRELEVLHLLAAGLSNQAIAKRLILSSHTVRNHTASIYAKLAVENRLQAVERARSLGLLTHNPA